MLRISIKLQEKVDMVVQELLILDNPKKLEFLTTIQLNREEIVNTKVHINNKDRIFIPILNIFLISKVEVMEIYKLWNKNRIQSLRNQVIKNSIQRLMFRKLNFPTLVRP